MSSNNNSKYLPPHLRNKQKVAEVFSAPPAPEPPKEKPYEEQFPALKGTLPNTAKVWGGEGSFAEKAREWSLHDKMKKQEEEEARKDNEMVNNFRSRNLPRFHNVRRFIEEDNEEQDDNPKQDEKNDDDWTTVEYTRKPKKQKTVEEIVREKMAKDSGSEGENEDTVWNQEKQPNETYWDERY